VKEPIEDECVQGPQRNRDRQRERQNDAGRLEKMQKKLEQIWRALFRIPFA